MHMHLLTAWLTLAEFISQPQWSYQLWLALSAIHGFQTYMESRLSMHSIHASFCLTATTVVFCLVPGRLVCLGLIIRSQYRQ